VPELTISERQKCVLDLALYVQGIASFGSIQARKMFNGSDNFSRTPCGGFIQLDGLALELDHWNFLGIDEFPMCAGPQLPNLIRVESWTPWTEKETGSTCIMNPSNARQNPFQDANEHMRQRAAIVQNDAELAVALQTGDSIATNCEKIRGVASSYDRRSQSLVDPQTDRVHGDDSKLIDSHHANKV